MVDKCVWSDLPLASQIGNSSAEHNWGTNISDLCMDFFEAVFEKSVSSEVIRLQNLYELIQRLQKIARIPFKIST